MSEGESWDIETRRAVLCVWRLNARTGTEMRTGRGVVGLGGGAAISRYRHDAHKQQRATRIELSPVTSQDLHSPTCLYFTAHERRRWLSSYPAVRQNGRP